MTFKLEITKCFKPQWLSPAIADALLEAVSELTYRTYAYRASVLKRAPKREFYVPFEDGSLPLYRWGQSRSEYVSGRPITELPALDTVRQRIATETGEACNHCIIIEYSDGQNHHAPPHRDRQQGVAGSGAHDMAADTSFFVLTLGYARPFQLLNTDHEVVWEERLPHGSLLQVTSTMNRELYHAVPRDPTQPSDQSRYSLIFRTIRCGNATSVPTGLRSFAKGA